MVTVTMNDFRIKRDEMFRLAENLRLIRAARKNHSPAPRLFNTLRIAISIFIA
jgi:hypothetical protein